MKDNGIEQKDTTVHIVKHQETELKIGDQHKPLLTGNATELTCKI